ncbi:ferrochelatase hem15 [Elasticomyces elasticus]|nr:ferrochelatase hem15 [Elasticomyces elasticus]
MLQKIRRSSQRWIDRRRDSVVPIRSTRNDDVREASFLGLPPEIRNQIYEHLATTTRLTLPPIKLKKKPQPVGLLLACRQTHQEYRELLLSTANIVAHIDAFEFGNLMRVLKALQPKDVSALKTNQRLRVSLFLSHVPSREERRAMLAWFVYRGGTRNEMTIRFGYDVQFNTRLRPPGPPSRCLNGHYMSQDLLVTFVGRYVSLRPAVKELVGDTRELDRMLKDLQSLITVMNNPA